MLPLIVLPLETPATVGHFLFSFRPNIFLFRPVFHLYQAAWLASQGQILAVWILAVKLPNSDLNFAVDFGVNFSFVFEISQGKGS